MSDERQASALDRLVEAIGFSQAHVAATCAEGHDLTPQPQLLAAIDEVKAYIATLEADRALLEAACDYYVAADFDYPQYEGYTCLILALPEGERAGADLRKTLAALSSSPLAPTQEGA